MTKQLNMKVIKEDTKKYKEFIELPVGDEYIVKIYPYFSPTKVTTMLNEMATFYKNAKTEKVDVNEKEFDDIIGYFITKTFTDIGMSKSKKAKTLYEEFRTLKDSVLFELILKSIPMESLEYVYKKVDEMIEFSAKLQSKMELMKKQINDLNLNNPEILGSTEV